MKKLHLVFLLIIYLVYHLLTLNVSPLPWYDEVVFNSIAHSFAHDGTFFCKVGPLAMEGKQIVVYGPVFFVSSGILESIFGMGII